MDKFTEAVIGPYLELSIEELYIELAKETATPNQALPGADDLIELGKLRFHQAADRLRPHLCGPKAKKVLTQDTDKKALFVVIGDIVATELTGFPLVLITVLIAKMGIEKFCASFATPA